MLRRRLRRHLRVGLLLQAPVVVCLIGWFNGCDPPPASSQVQITKAEAKKFLKEGDKTVKAIQGGVVVDAKSATKALDAGAAATQNLIYLNFTGTASVTVPRGTRGFGGFTKASFRGGGKVGYIGTSDALAGDGEALLKFSGRGAGTACLRFSATTDITQQYVTGTFAILGGTGQGARLHDSGAFRAVQPNAFVTNKYQVALYGTPSFGASRHVPKECGKPVKAPPQKTFTATFAGFAFAPASARNGSLPAGTKLYVDQTITGHVGCGADNNLYLVIDYSGPPGATLAGSFSDTTSGGLTSLQQSLHAGQNAVFLLASPPNHGFSLKAGVAPPPGATGSGEFGQGVRLIRSC